MPTMRLFCAVAVLAAVATGVAPARADATAFTTVHFVPAGLVVGPVTRSQIEACLGEPVTFVGRDVLVVHVTELPDGFAVVLHANPQGDLAVGESGTTYRVAAAGTLAEFSAPAGGFVFTQANNLRVFDPGGGAGFFGHLLLHVTVTPDGDVTAVIEVIDVDCG